MLSAAGKKEAPKPRRKAPRCSKNSSANAGDLSEKRGELFLHVVLDLGFAVAAADPASLSSSVYNVCAFSVRADAIAEQVRRAFPGAVIDYAPDPVRARIVASWPEDMDVARAREEWGFSPVYAWDSMFDEYIVPALSSPKAR